MEFLPRPFESMVAMAKLAGRQCLPFHVVFAVGRGEDNCRRLGRLEEHALECGEAWWVEMFDHFDNGSGIKTCQALVSINKRAMKKAQALLFTRRQAIVMQPVAGDFKAAIGDIQADNLSELLLFQERSEEH